MKTSETDSLTPSHAKQALPSAIPSNKNNNFNLIRFLLASLVILGHSGEMLDGDIKQEFIYKFFGGTATAAGLSVSGFFLLSGFLIVQSWERNPNLLQFFKNRILRIYPGFVVASALSVIIVGALGSSSPQYLNQLSVPQFLKGVILLRVPVTPPVFESQHHPIVNGSLWTIEYEFRCYMIVALMGICGLIKWRKGWLSLLIFVFLLSTIPGAMDRIINFIPIPHMRLFISDPSRLRGFLGLFCVGGAFYLFRDRIVYRANWAFITAAVLFFCMFDPRTAGIALAFLGGYILFWFAFAQFPLIDRFRKYSDISYGVYLYGWPMQKLLIWYWPSISTLMLFLLAWGLSCLCGLLSWHFVERPFLRLKQRDSKLLSPA